MDVSPNKAGALLKKVIKEGTGEQAPDGKEGPFEVKVCAPRKCGVRFC